MSRNVIVVDTETDGYGGFKPPAQRLVQIAFIYNDEQFSTLVRGAESMNPTVPHKITVNDCEEKGVSPQKALTKVLNYIKLSDVIVGHNITFDLDIIRHNMILNNMTSELKELNNCLKEKQIVCTMKSTTKLCRIPGKYSYKWPKLIELHSHLFDTQLDANILHDALEDCKITHKCYNLLQTRGIFS